MRKRTHLSGSDFLKSRESGFLEILNALNKPIFEHIDWEIDEGILQGERIMHRLFIVN